MTLPLFVADLATVKSQLRLTGVSATSTDTLAILDSCILRARLDFNRRLGESRVAALVAITEIAEPVTKDQVLRSLASQVEIDLIFCSLLERLPVSFMDASGDQDKRWNEEAPFREDSGSELQARIKRTKVQIENDMQMLEDDEESLGSEQDWRVFDGTPVVPSPVPGSSTQPTRYNNRTTLG